MTTESGNRPSEDGHREELRYEISATVGPCAESDVDFLLWKIARVIKPYGGAVSSRELADSPVVSPEQQEGPNG